jgi:long-chain acyl-CoA synthetase
MSAQTIVDKFWERVRLHPNKVALRHKSGGRWEKVTWGKYGDSVRRVGAALMSLGFGRGDRMSLLATNRPEWFVADLACMSVGGTTAPVYVTNSPQQVAHVIGHSGSKVAVVEDDAQLDKVLTQSLRLPELERVVVIEGRGHGPSNLVLTWDELGRRAEEASLVAFDEATASVAPDDVATFVYTSGTTGPPKAVMLTHASIWWTCQAIERHLQIYDPPSQRALSYLPLSHIAERMVSHMLQILFGSQTWFATSAQTLPEDLRDCAPTYFFGVPRVWEKFYAVVKARLEAEPKDLKARIEIALLNRALEVGRRVSEAEQRAVARGGKLSDARLGWLLQFEHGVLERAVLSGTRTRAGLGQCDRLVSSAAALNEEIVWFFHSMGLKLAEGYGQSETCGPTTWNPPDAIRIGTVGTPLPGVDLKIAGDGEILVKGGNVTAGYFQDAAATGDLFDENGWLCSGDLGEVDEHGYLRITERKKDIIVTSGGKNIAPQEIENKLKFDEIISEALVVGEGRPFLTALFALDEAKAREWARAEGLPEELAALVRHERTLGRLRAAVAGVNATLARAEGIKRFRVIEREFSQEEGEMTPTLKVRRNEITKRYGDLIEEMYGTDAPDAAPVAAPGVGSSDGE